METDRAGPHPLPLGATAAWAAVGCAAALTLAAGAMWHAGFGAKGTELALRLTARLAFLFFLPSYAGGALTTLWGAAFLPLKRRARAFGLTFAAILGVHLMLVAWKCWIGSAPALQTFAIFSPAAIAAALLALASIEPLGRAIGPTGWWILSNVGMTYIAFVFALDFVRPQNLTTLSGLVGYAPFAALAVGALLLRPVAQFVARRRELAVAH